MPLEYYLPSDEPPLPYIKCDRCEGTGKLGERSCPHCGGRGETLDATEMVRRRQAEVGHLEQEPYADER